MNDIPTHGIAVTIGEGSSDTINFDLMSLYFIRKKLEFTKDLLKI